MSSLSRYTRRHAFDDKGNLIENPFYIPGLQETRLIQRFKFRGDGLSPCYMGSYELEVADIRGALEKVLSGIKDDSYSMVSLRVFGPPAFPFGMGGRTEISWFDLEGLQKKLLLEANILIFCPNHLHSYAEELFRELALEDEADRRLQDPSFLRDSLFSKLEWDHEGANREWSPMHPDALLDLDNAILAFLTEPCAQHFCETFGISYIDGSVKPADFTAVESELQMFRNRERLHELQRVSKKKKRHEGKLPG